MYGEITFEIWQQPKNVMLFESISNCLHFEKNWNSTSRFKGYRHETDFLYHQI